MTTRKQKPRKSTKKRSTKPRQARKVGRPTAYKPEYAETARLMCEQGAIDRELAFAFKVSLSTLKEWKHVHPEFSTALKAGKEVADERVKDSLYQRAVGYSYDSEKIMQHQGKPVRVPCVEHVPPDTTAAIFWLKNRKPEEWRDRFEHTGPNGGPVAVAVLNVSRSSPAESGSS